MKVVIIIPNYNGSEILRRNLPSVITATNGKKDVSIVVVDDGSIVEDLERTRVLIDDFKKENSKIQLVEHKKNKGFSSAVNTGAKTEEADIYILLNSDISVQKDLIEKVTLHFQNSPELFGIGFMDQDIDHGKLVLRGRGIGKWKKGLLVHARGEVDRDSTLWISGGSAAVRGDLFHKFSGFDELYNPFYWEDIDLSYRAQKAGYVIRFIRDIEVEHKHETGAIRTHFSKKQINTISYKNQFIFHWKNITDTPFILSHIFWFPYHLVSALKRGDGAFMHGLFKAIILLPRILKKRKRGMKKMSDKSILFRVES